MSKYEIPFWKEAPFIRLIIPFIFGILISYHTSVSESILQTITGISSIGLMLFYFLPLKQQFQLRLANGVLLMLLFVSLGAYVTSIRNPLHIENLDESRFFIMTLDEFPVEKRSSWKALAHNDSCIIIVYFKKDSSRAPPQYGNSIAFTKPPVRIQNFVEGSSFDYERYCALKNIHYQVFLGGSDYVVIDSSSGNLLYRHVYGIQQWVIATLQRYIPGKKEYGLAQALLIGYRNDLDKELNQSYSNTGIVHVVAISGLHLGLIYALLNFMCSPLSAGRTGKVIKPIIVLAGLWLFSLLAGASPSVLRSAVMFSFMVVGQSVSRRTSMLNTLSASAFLLLYYQPYWLWDLGFILSYAALLSIMCFMKPIYNALVPQNKMLEQLWKLNAVTLSAQVLTMPVLLYYFHQFPTLFLFTNMVAIPLSSVILIGEIILCVVSFAPPVATLTGKLLTILIQWMNGAVEYADSFSFSSVKGLNISFLQLALLYIFIAWVFLVVLQPFKATR